MGAKATNAYLCNVPAQVWKDVRSSSSLCASASGRKMLTVPLSGLNAAFPNFSRVEGAGITDGALIPRANGGAGPGRGSPGTRPPRGRASGSHLIAQVRGPRTPAGATAGDRGSRGSPGAGSRAALGAGPAGRMRGQGRGGAGRGCVAPASRTAAAVPGAGCGVGGGLAAGAGGPAPGARPEPTTWRLSGGAAAAGPGRATRPVDDGTSGRGRRGPGGPGRWPGALRRRGAGTRRPLAGGGAHP